VQSFWQQDCRDEFKNKSVVFVIQKLFFCFEVGRFFLIDLLPHIDIIAGQAMQLLRLHH